MTHIATIVLGLIGLRFGSRGLIAGLILGQLLDRTQWPARLVRAAIRALNLGRAPCPECGALLTASARGVFTCPRCHAGERAADPYQVLGLDRRRNPSPDEIREAYRKLAQQYHPDKVNHLAPEFQRLAESKFRAIKDARDQLVGQREGDA